MLAFVPVGCPVVVFGNFGSFFLEFHDIGGDRVGRFMLAMQQCDCIGDAGIDEGAGSEAVITRVNAAASGEVCHAMPYVW